MRAAESHQRQKRSFDSIAEQLVNSKLNILRDFLCFLEDDAIDVISNYWLSGKFGKNFFARHFIFSCIGKTKIQKCSGSLWIRNIWINSSIGQWPCIIWLKTSNIKSLVYNLNGHACMDLCQTAWTTVGMKLIIVEIIQLVKPQNPYNIHSNTEQTDKFY